MEGNKDALDSALPDHQTMQTCEDVMVMHSHIAMTSPAVFTHSKG